MLLEIGRVLIGLLFICSAINDFYYKKVLYATVASSPASALRYFYNLSLVLMLIAGILLIINYWMLPAVIYLTSFLVIVTPLYHPLWKVDEETLIVNRLNWISNLAHIGSLLILLSLSSL